MIRVCHNFIRFTFTFSFQFAFFIIFIIQKTLNFNKIMTSTARLQQRSKGECALANSQLSACNEHLNEIEYQITMSKKIGPNFAK